LGSELLMLWWSLVRAMSTKPDCKWRIVHIKGTPGTTIGYVEAPDKHTAIDRAIETFKINARLR
jgi:hypothetical protein